MAVYHELKERLEEMLEDCLDDKIKPGDIEAIKDVVKTIYDLNGIIMAEEYNYYGEDGRRTYSARGRSRDSRGRYRRYGHDREDMIHDLEMKMANMSGEDQDIMRRAINIIERG